MFFNKIFFVPHTFKAELRLFFQKSCIRETPTLSTDADSRTYTNFKRLRDLSNNNKKCVEGANERPGSGHVICGPMRGLKQNYMKRGHLNIQTNPHRDY